jgi:hypothetical protein
MADDGWTAWDSFKDWVWQTLYTNVGAFLWTGAGKAVVTALGTLAAAAIAYFADAKHKQEIVLVGLGAIGACGVISIWTWVQSKLSTSPTATDAAQPQRPSQIEHAATPREEIGFDYLPDSPISHGWRAEWAKHPIPSDAIWKMSIGGSLVMELSDIYCPIDYRVSKRAVLSTRLVCDLRFSDSALFFVLFKLVTRDQSRNKEGPVKFELGRGQPYYTKEYDEWVLPIDPKPLGDGWHHLDISLADSVSQTWGQAGWTLSELFKIRLRGHLSISPIKLY